MNESSPQLETQLDQSMKRPKITGLWFALACLSILIGQFCIAGGSPCLPFYNELSKLPHSNLTLNDDGFVSIWDGKSLNGCEITFESDESKVSGNIVYRKFESFIIRPGWIIDNKKCADGPGSSIVGIENNQNQCVIHWEQQAWIDETGEHQQSNEIRLIVQCSER